MSIATVYKSRIENFNILIRFAIVLKICFVVFVLSNTIFSLLIFFNIIIMINWLLLVERWCYSCSEKAINQL